MSESHSSGGTERPESQVPEHFFVGIGSSAGGLEAIRDFARALSPDVNATFVIAQHMAPQRLSLMTSLVASETALPVRDVEDGIVPERGVIYITPPNKDVVIENGRMVLCAPSPEAASPKPSIDRFFISLAEAMHERAVGVVLSGTGSDGAYGIQSMRGMGGVTIAQDTTTAKYDGMPNAAVATGAVDLVLSPRDIGLHLARILDSAEELERFRSREKAPAPLTDIMQILLARTRVDFNEYKSSTIQRRIERRMLALGMADQEAYTDFCRASPDEVDMLFKDLLISVTRFFRDLGEFMDLAKMIKELLATRTSGGIRIWTAGCATGEEAYSIAMLVAEALGGPGALASANVQIFATDLDDKALAVAREGRYPLAALADVPRDLVEKYFRVKSSTAQVIAPLRDCILFAHHNICTDPPFVKLDLVVCRNLLIYFRASLQRKVLSRLHYALLPRGALFLGTAETTLAAEDQFVQVASGAHIYRKRILPELRSGDRGVRMPSFPSTLDIRGATPASRSQDEEQTRAARMLFEGLARSVGPNSAIVTEDHRIVRVMGDLSEIMSLQENANPTLSTRLLRAPFDREAQSLVTLSLKHSARRAGVVHRDFMGTEGRCAQLEAFPIITDPNERSVLVAFRTWVETEGPGITGEIDVSQIDDITQAHLRALETELATTREALQQMVEELETSNEELQALNEELQSANEELQATNEELETSNEELQSTNEELVTVNEELQVNAAELSNLWGELESILENLGVPVLAVDAALQVTHANDATLELMGWEQTPINVHLSQVSLPEYMPNLATICAETTRTGLSIDQELEDGDLSYTLRCAPFYNEAGQIRGSTMVFAGTSDSHYARELRHILDHTNIEILQTNEAGDVFRASRLLAERLGTTRAGLEGRNLAEFMSPEQFRDSQARLVAFLETGLDANVGEPHAPLGSDDPDQIVQVQKTRYEDPLHGQTTVFSFTLDITEAMKGRRAEARTRLLEDIQALTGAGFHVTSPATGKSEYSDLLLSLVGIGRDEMDASTPDEMRERLYPPEDLAFAQQLRERAFREGQVASYALRMRHSDGHLVPVQVRIRRIGTAGSHDEQVIGVLWPLPEEALPELPYEGTFPAPLRVV